MTDAIPGETHTRTRMEIIVEAPLLRRVEELLSEAGVHVFTVVEGREGRGLAGRWQDAAVADALDQRLIVAVAPQTVAAQAVAALARLFERYPGVVLLSEVQVLRAERF
jgi:nitrogen regulatory protein PII